jgi:hypothetical protein
MVVVYAPYGTRPPRKDVKLLGISIPIPANIDETFSENIVVEYEYIKKITFVALPFFIVLTATSFVDHNIRIPSLLLTEYPFTASFSPMPISIYEVLSSLWAALFFVVSGVLLRMLFWLGRKEFRYYFARGCAKRSRREYGIRQIRYVMLALDYYNRYLQTVRQIIIEWGAVAATVIPLLATIIKEFALK